MNKIIAFGLIGGILILAIVGFINTQRSLARNSPATDSSLEVNLSFSSSTIITQGGCYIGGCSGEVCSDTPGIVSTCIYRSQYACYKKAVCTRQVNGRCGWTQTNTLQACLSNNRAETNSNNNIQ